MRLAIVIVGELGCGSVLVVQFAIFARDVFPVSTTERELAHLQYLALASRMQGLPWIGCLLARARYWWDGVCTCTPPHLTWRAFAARIAGIVGMFILCLLFPLIGR
jgi:hypothetical protein